ncbi:MAG: glycosyltransferase family 2 protein [Propioniciclava sp.]|uniref:glycosyltransferase family 2 protein n=1 Tax=Propioniciclava sp. TaxID=2038686 RepID=UPI0039E6A7A5
MPRLSIVLPVYNVERYLAVCLDTVRQQSVTDLEIVCVDDGSTDRSRVLLEMAAGVDPRVVIVTKENGGLSSARNAGLDAATGDVVWFVDSDDFVHPKACATILAAFEETDAEVVTFGAYPHPGSLGNGWLHRTLTPRARLFQGFHPDLLFAEASRPFVWRSAFRRDFLLREGLRFDESVPFGEDQVFYFEAYPLARVTALIADKLYYYRVSRPDSLMASRFAERATMMTEHHHITRVILDWWRERGWLDAYRAEMLGWVFEFLATDAIGESGELGRDLLASFARLLGEFFPDGPWLSALPAATQQLYAELAGGQPGSDERSRQAALLAWQGARGPEHAARALARRVRDSATVAKARGVAGRIMPATVRAERDRFRELAEQMEDQAQRQQALAMLELEWRFTVRADG